MSANGLVTIFCDAPSCGEWDDAGIAKTAKRARDGLRGNGWLLAVPHPDGGPTLDYCPKHTTRTIPTLTPTTPNQEQNR